MPSATTTAPDISFEDAQLIALTWRSLKQSIESVYRDGVDQILTVALEGDNFTGKFRDGKQVYNFTITPSGKISYVEMEGRSDSYLIGFYLDSEFSDAGSSAAYRQGFLNQQVMRGDRTSKAKQCQKGKPCGSTCVARGVMCNQNLKPRQQQELQTVQKVIKKKPKLLRMLSNPRVTAAIAITAGILLWTGASIYGLHLNEKEARQADEARAAWDQNRAKAWKEYEERKQKWEQQWKRQAESVPDPFDMNEEDVKEEYREAWKQAKQTWEGASNRQRSQGQQQQKQGGDYAGQAESQSPLGNDNWWDVLGIPQNATAKDVLKTFRKLAKENHPDLVQDPKEKAARDKKMRKINAAYEVAQKNFPRKDSAFWEI